MQITSLQNSTSVDILSPSHFAVVKAERQNAVNGHENLGFLSFERGFMPLLPPAQKLPKSFSLWDEVAGSLPQHYRNQTLRQALRELPVLFPGESNLEDKYLCRASLIISILAHAYVRCERIEDSNIPESVLVPWQEITRRLQRPEPFLSYIDLIVYNWKQRNPSGPLEVENLDLLVPTVNNNEERIFYSTQIEMLAKSASLVKEVTIIQNAILSKDVNTVINGLRNIQATIELITRNTFSKVNLNPRSKTYVDPVIWAKTVAPFAVPIKDGVLGPSGLSSPLFHLLDIFFERHKYDTVIGQETLALRDWYPLNWRFFLDAVECISLSKFISRINNSELSDAYHSSLESYCGEKGFLGVHKIKAYGYLQTAFKVGRSMTIVRFSGIFKERIWEKVDDELENSRLERFANKNLKCPFATYSGDQDHE